MGVGFGGGELTASLPLRVRRLRPLAVLREQDELGFVAGLWLIPREFRKR